MQSKQNPLARWITAAVVAAALVRGDLISAQTVLNADRLRLNAGPCGLSSLDGTPDRLVLAPCPVLTTEAATNLTLAPTGDLVLGPTGADVLPNLGYTQNLGALTNKYLTLHAAELWVETLVAQNTIATIGGRVLVGPTTTLTADLSVGATSISVKHNQIANGARIYLEANGALEWMAVTSGPSGTGPYTYTVTRNLDGSGANAWTAGDAVFNTGTTGDGFIDLYSVAGVLGGAGPTIVGNARTGTTYNNVAPRWAIGNLNGLYGYGATTYGTAFGDASATNVTIDATNGFRIRSGTTNRLTADTAGNLSLLGDLSLGTASVFRSSTATGLNTGDGFYLTGGSTPTFRIGNPAGNRLVYDAGTGVLQVVGNGNGLTSIGPGSLTVGTGRNMIRNSDCAVGMADWAFGTNTGLPQSNGKGLASWNIRNAGDNTCYTMITGTPALNSSSLAYTSPFYPVVAGKRYEASAYLGLHRASSAFVYIQWYAADATTGTGTANGTTCTTTAPGGTELEDFCRSGVVATAPASTAYARHVVVMVHNGTEANPYVFFVHNYFGEAQSGQTELTPWGPAGVTSIVGGMIEANTITADRLSVSTLAAITANLGTVTTGTIDGVTGIFGSGNEVTLDNNGVTLAAGNGLANKIKWSGNSSIFEYIGSLNITSNSDISLSPGSGTLWLGGSVWYPGSGSGSTNIGLSSVRIGTAYLTTTDTTSIVLGSGTITKSGWGGGGSRYVCVDNAGALSVGASC
jgi:hypothetical protein